MTNQKIFADLAELAGGAVGVLASLKQQLRDETKERMDEFASRMDLVTRTDIDRLEGMIAKLRARVDALEKVVSTSTQKSKAAPTKPTAKAKPKTSAKQKSNTAKKK